MQVKCRQKGINKFGLSELKVLNNRKLGDKQIKPASLLALLSHILTGFILSMQ
jgi:hypothetical protein